MMGAGDLPGASGEKLSGRLRPECGQACAWPYFLYNSGGEVLAWWGCGTPPLSNGNAEAVEVHAVLQCVLVAAFFAI